MGSSIVEETISYFGGKPRPFVIPATSLQLGIQDSQAAINATIGYMFRKASAFARNQCTCGACTWSAHGRDNWA